MNRQSRSMAPYQREAAASRDNQVALGGGRTDDMFGGMMNHHKQMKDQMNNMVSQAFGGHGGDPFENDPFFAGMPKMPKMGGIGGFGGMDKMFDDMQGQMSDMMRHAGSMKMSSGDLGPNTRFQTMQQKITSKQGQDGRPVQQSYKTTTKGAIDKNGQRITEKQQIYENQANGHQKMAHERMLNDRGRKMVKQTQGSNSHQEDLFHNMNNNGVNQSDSDWNRMADQMGFNSKHNRLAYGGGGATDQNQNGYQDEARRGHYMPQNARGQNAAVRMNHESRGLAAPQQARQERRNDLMPTNPMPLPERGAIPIGGVAGFQQQARANQIRQADQPRQPNAPIALTSGNPRQAAPLVGRAAAAQPRNYQAPAQKTQKPARAG